ncbi:MAG: tyrosine--tRNA ligase [Candidatus Saccharimonadales bacterium]
MTLSEELTWRGFVNQTTYKDVSVLDGQPITFYLGVDPSASSMTIGNLAMIMMVRHFIESSHKAILLVGGATGMIGDPDGKADERNLKTIEEIATYKTGIVGQYKSLLGDQGFVTVDNYDWFKDIDYLDFLRDVGKHVPMRQMLGREFVQTRLSEAGSGISYAEFSYVLIQAYDFLHLHRELGVNLQVCGADQWGNCIAGVDLIRRVTGDEANVWSAPLVVNKTTGVKFGKSEAGAIWLDANKTSVNDFYQFWLNVDDAGVESYIKIYTLLSKEDVDRTIAEFNSNRSGRVAQKRLAYEVTKLVHGVESADTAKDYAESLQSSNLEETGEEIVVEAGSSIIDALVAIGLATSKSDARQTLAGGGIYINDSQVDRDSFQESDFKDSVLRLRKGKKLQNTRIIKLRG